MATALIQAVGVGLAVAGERRQAKAIDDQNKEQRKLANLEAKRARRNQIRQLQVAQADTTSAGVSTGAQFSSSVSGGRTAAASSAGSNIQGINQGQEIGQNISNARTRQNTGQGLSSLGGTVTESAPLITRLANL